MIEERRNIKQANRAAGRPVPELNDAIDWADDEAEITGVTYDEAKFQLALSVAAIHTKTDLLEQVMLDLAQRLVNNNPKPKLTSILHAPASMRRWVERDVTLSTGLRLTKGTRINIDSCRLWDPELHENPDQWDGRRFLKLRSQEGKEH